MRIEIRGNNKVWVDGQPYAPAKELAHICRLSPDYLTRLARTGQVKAVRVAGAWHLSLKSLAHFVGGRNLDPRGLDPRDTAPPPPNPRQGDTASSSNSALSP